MTHDVSSFDGTHHKPVDSSLSSLQGYLKLYQLSKPQISLYDCLFIDEAQDLTPGKTHAAPHHADRRIVV